MNDRPADYKETSVNIVHRPDKIAYIWTENRRWISRLKHLGFEPVRKQGPGHWYAIPERCLWLKSRRRVVLSDEKRAILRDRMAAVNAAKK